MKDKDYYDIYALTGFHRGNPNDAAKAYCKLISAKKLDTLNPFILSSLRNISRTFEKVSSIGPFMVSRFVGDDLNTDAYERVTAFIVKVKASLDLKF